MAAVSQTKSIAAKVNVVVQTLNESNGEHDLNLARAVERTQCLLTSHAACGVDSGTQGLIRSTFAMLDSIGARLPFWDNVVIAAHAMIMDLQGVSKIVTPVPLSAWLAGTQRPRKVSQPENVGEESARREKGI